MSGLFGLFYVLFHVSIISLSEADAAREVALQDLVAFVRDLEARVNSLDAQVKRLRESKVQRVQTARDLEQSFISTGRRMDDFDAEFSKKIDGIMVGRKQIDNEIKAISEQEKRAESRLKKLDYKFKVVNRTIEKAIQEQPCIAVSRCVDGSNVKRQETTPNDGIIAFSTYLDHTLSNLAPNQSLKYNQELLNEGDSYNSTTGVFTVPVGGIYIFSWTVATRDDGNMSVPDIWMKLVVNGQHKATVVAESTQERDDEMGTNIVFLQVEKGDAVWISHHDQGFTRDVFSSDSLRVVTFSGALLHE